MEKYTRIAIFGALGKMGKIIIKQIHQNSNFNITTAIVKKNDPNIGKDIGKILGIKNSNIVTSDNLEEKIEFFDILIDFSSTSATLNNLFLCEKYKKKMIIGTTGFKKSEIEKIKKSSKKIAIIFSANFSIGINLILNTLEKITKTLISTSDVEIIEYHHNKKIDAPSGTALMLGKKIADTMKWKLENHSIYERKGKIGVRPTKKIGFSTIRGGDIIGEHTIMFASSGERIEITHKASNRALFANGVIKALKWILKKDIGYFNMEDVLKI
ncbi:4-hydroxy-tetrahydrodipicolinate reductase [Buchnera aphidicola]|uniref:4-hydroxy-tetrahydrodipicolinate reductase n=1 Tax=Buchnera aphidicola TaxID=9 RepID=UPI003464A1BD